MVHPQDVLAIDDIRLITGLISTVISTEDSIIKAINRRSRLKDSLFVTLRWLRRRAPASRPWRRRVQREVPTRLWARFLSRSRLYDLQHCRARTLGDNVSQLVSFEGWGFGCEESKRQVARHGG